jgi:hypothetical protein
MNINADKIIKKVTREQELNRLWDFMIDNGIATFDEIKLVTSIMGTRLITLNSILYSRTGYHDLEQYIECEGSV